MMENRWRRSSDEVKRLQLMAAEQGCSYATFLRRVDTVGEEIAILMGRPKGKAKLYTSKSFGPMPRSIVDWISFLRIKTSYDAVRKWVHEFGIDEALSIAVLRDKEEQGAKLKKIRTGKKRVSLQRPYSIQKHPTSNYANTPPSYEKKEKILGIRHLIGKKEAL